MTDKTMGGSFDNYFIAEVIDVNDPEQVGRVKVRVKGRQDNTSEIPDHDLRWARCIFPVSNPSHGGVGGPHTGLLKGSIIMGFYADQDGQIPLVMGSLGKAGVPNDPQNPSGGIKIDGANHDVPHATREKDQNIVLAVSVIKKADKLLKFNMQKTIGNVPPSGKKPVNTITSVDGSNESGTVKSALHMLKDLKSLAKSVPFDAKMGSMSSLLNPSHLIAGLGDMVKKLGGVQVVPGLAQEITKDLKIGPPIIDSIIKGGTVSVVPPLNIDHQTVLDSALAQLKISLNLSNGIPSFDSIAALVGSMGIMSAGAHGVSSVAFDASGQVTEISSAIENVLDTDYPTIGTYRNAVTLPGHFVKSSTITNSLGVDSILSRRFDVVSGMKVMDTNIQINGIPI